MISLIALLAIMAVTFIVHVKTESATYLNITALTARDSISVLECWQLATPFTTSMTSGRESTKSLRHTNPSNTTYDIIPAGFNSGLHNAPRKQFVWWISGLVHFTLPNATNEAWIRGGSNGLIFGDDTADLSIWGHGAEYPGGEETVALAIPTEDGLVPEHTVLHDGACENEDLVGITRRETGNYNNGHSFAVAYAYCNSSADTSQGDPVDVGTPGADPS